MDSYDLKRAARPGGIAPGFRDRPFRIAILSHGLRVAGGLSVGRNFLSALARVAPDHEYLLTLPPGIGYEKVAAAFPKVRLCFFENGRGLLRRLRFENAALPKILRAFQPDILLGLGNMGVNRPLCRQAILLQDSHLVSPRHMFGPMSAFDLFLMEYNRCRFCNQLRRTDLVFCQTHTMRRSLVRFLGYQGRTALFPNAISEKEESSSGAERLGLSLPRNALTLLCLTRYYPHKNLEWIVREFEKYSRELRGVVVILTISAADGDGAMRLLAGIERRGLGDQIINIGPVGSEQLADLYQHCDGLLLPTLLESFSVTYLEAMSHGRAILTSDRAFAREICDRAALYFDPTSPGGMTKAILRLRDEPGLATRLVAWGGKRFEKVGRSWDDIVRSVEAELVRLVGRHSFGECG